MSENNINDIFVDDEEDNEEESKEDEDDEELGGATNEIIIPQVAAIAALLSMGYNPPQQNEVLPIRRIRPREADLQSPNKAFKNTEGKRIVRKRTSLYSYLCLKSGEEFYFKEDFHLCLLKQIRYTQIPNLVFFSLYFLESSYKNCYECYSNITSFKIKLKLSLKEVYKHKQFCFHSLKKP